MVNPELTQRLSDGYSEYADPNFPGLYWFDDPAVAAPVVETVIAQGRFGVEVGMGAFPCLVTNIDPDIPWLLYDPGDDFNDAKTIIQDIWHPDTIAEIKFPIIMVKDYANRELIKRAQTLAYCNYDYNLYKPPFRANLQSGQRLVVIKILNIGCQEISAGSEDFRNTINNLSYIGYDRSDIVARSNIYPRFSSYRKVIEYVLDVTG